MLDSASIVMLVGALMSGASMTHLLTIILTILLSRPEVIQFISEQMSRWSPNTDMFSVTYILPKMTNGPWEGSIVTDYIIAKGYATNLQYSAIVNNGSYPHMYGGLEINIIGKFSTIRSNKPIVIDLPNGKQLVITAASNDKDTTVTITTQYKADFDKLVVDAMRKALQSRKLSQCRARSSTWGIYTLTTNQTLDQLYWPEAEKAKLMQIGADFTEQFASYKFRPHKHVVLLSGPPGTGKTCTAAMMARHFKANLYCLPPPFKGTKKVWSEDDDNNVPTSFVDTLSTLIFGIVTPAVILWDEFDLVHSSGEDEDKPFISLVRSFLNGELIKNIVVILTTNNPDRLCPIMTRPGRVDTHLKIGLASSEIMQRAAHDYERPDMKIPTEPMAMSEFLQLMAECSSR